MKKASCILLAALLMLLCSVALAECAEGCNFEWKHDETHCWVECTGCGDKNSEVYEHIINCKGVCTLCGATDAVGEGRHMCNEVGYDENQCWYICNDCGEKVDASEHYSYCGIDEPGKCQRCGQPCETTHRWSIVSTIPGNCKVGDTHEMVCSTEGCGATKTEVGESTGECWYELKYDATSHWHECTGCGQVKEGKQEHFSNCQSENPGTCYLCDQPCEITHSWQEIDCVYSTCVVAGKAEYQCANGCGATKTETLPLDADYHATMEETASTNPNCKELGTQTFTCPDCGYEEVTTWGTLGECWFEMVNQGAQHAYVCTGCGTVDWAEDHYLSCTGGSACAGCGATGVTGEIVHAWDGSWQHDQTSHWAICSDCGEKFYNWEHWAYCDAPDACINCGATGVTIRIDHYATENSAVGFDATSCWYLCDKCGEACYKAPHQYDETTGKCIYCGQAEVVEEHDHVWEVTETVAATCTEFGNEHSVCTICGEGSDKQTYPTGHFWKHTTTKDPTCTKEGRHNYECRECDATSIKKLPATGHTMVLTATGSACSACDYTEEAALAVTPVENVAVEGENLSADVTLVVEQPQDDVSALLPETVRTGLQQVYVVKLLEKGEAIEPNGSIKVSIQLEEGADLTGKKLMLLNAEGELVEIAYEVVEGKLTFVTEAIGIFVLVDAPAE